jgi:hypothetical protein
VGVAKEPWKLDDHYAKRDSDGSPKAGCSLAIAVDYGLILLCCELNSGDKQFKFHKL